MPRGLEVVITGLGLVSPIGIGVAPFRDALAAGRSGVRRIERFDASGLPIDFGGEVADFDPKVYVKPRKSLKVMSRDIQFGFAAADMAFEDARLTSGTVDPDRFGVVFGADLIYCELDELAAAYRSCVVAGEFDFARWGQHALGEMYPLWLLKYLPNMIASHVGIFHDARGPTNAITSGEASSLLAIGEAARVIQRGGADVMIAGGASSRLHATILASRHGSAWSHRRDDPAAACRPFDADRDGMVAGEGAAAVILESRRHALARGAPIHAALLGFASAFQPADRNGAVLDAGQLGDPNTDAVRRVIVQALREAALAADDIGLVSAAGLSTIPHDRREAQAIRDTLGDVPVTATKSYFGNLGAGSGAVELAAALLALESKLVPVTLNYDRADPDCPIHVVHGQPEPLKRPAAIVLGQSTTGQTTAAVVGPADNF